MVQSIILSCLECGTELPINSALSRKYCNKCKTKRKKDQTNQKNARRRLKKIYLNFYIILKQNPYLKGIKHE